MNGYNNIQILNKQNQTTAEQNHASFHVNKYTRFVVFVTVSVPGITVTRAFAFCIEYRQKNLSIYQLWTIDFVQYYFPVIVIGDVLFFTILFCVCSVYCVWEKINDEMNPIFENVIMQNDLV